MRYSQDHIEELLKHEGIILSEDGYSYDNRGSGQDFTRFFCYGCLRSYKYWWMSRLCRKIHMVLQPNKVAAQMVR